MISIATPPILSKSFCLCLLSRLLQGVLWLNAVWLLLWNVLRWWPGERWWPVAVANYFTPWLGLALLPVITLTWLCRQRALSLAFLLAALLIGMRFIPLFFLKSPPPAGAYTLKVMTFNVHQRNLNVETILHIILKEDADIVALQELIPSVSERLLQALEERYAYHTLGSDQPVRGQGLLSRYALEQVSEGPDYRYQSAVVQTPKGRVTVLNIHTPSLFPFGWREDWEQQRRFMQNLAVQVSNIEDPLLVVGDFNTTPQSENYGLIRRYLRDAFLDSGWGFGFTYPATPKFGIRLPSPLVRIDYIFHSQHFTANDTRVLKNSGGSDHRPVVSVLSLLAE